MTLSTYPQNHTTALNGEGVPWPPNSDEPSLKESHSSCRGCGACTDKHNTISNQVNGEVISGYITPATSLLLFFLPSATAIIGTWLFNQTAVTQWLGGIGGFAAGILTAFVIARLTWNSDSGK